MENKLYCVMDDTETLCNDAFVMTDEMKEKESRIEDKIINKYSYLFEK